MSFQKSEYLLCIWLPTKLLGPYYSALPDPSLFSTLWFPLSFEGRLGETPQQFSVISEGRHIISHIYDICGMHLHYHMWLNTVFSRNPTDHCVAVILSTERARMTFYNRQWLNAASPSPTPSPGDVVPELRTRGTVGLQAFASSAI